MKPNVDINLAKGPEGSIHDTTAWQTKTVIAIFIQRADVNTYNHGHEPALRYLGTC